MKLRPAVLAIAPVALLALGCDRPSSQTTTTSASPPPTPQTLPSPEAPPSGAATPWQAKLDPDMKAVLDQLAAMHGKPIETLSAADARKQPTPADAVKALLDKQGKSTKPLAVGKVDDKTITAGAVKIPIRVYTPTGKGPFPVVVYFHGGGFVLATIDTYDASARALANGANAVVVSVEYRKGPENKFPAAHDDALAAYEWTRKNAASIGGDPNEIAVAGESAGGNLAIDVAIAARDKGEPLPVHELLVYPVASGNLSTPSETEYASAQPLSKAMMPWFFQQYTRTPADSNDPRLDVMDANVKGLPPTTIINAEIDPLRSDGENLAAKLRAAGVPVEQKTYAGVVHEFFGMGAAVARAKDAEDFAADRLRKSFSM